MQMHGKNLLKQDINENYFNFRCWKWDRVINSRKIYKNKHNLVLLVKNDKQKKLTKYLIEKSRNTFWEPCKF